MNEMLSILLPVLLNKLLKQNCCQVSRVKSNINEKLKAYHKQTRNSEQYRSPKPSEATREGYLAQSKWQILVHRNPCQSNSKSCEIKNNAIITPNVQSQCPYSVTCVCFKQGDEHQTNVNVTVIIREVIVQEPQLIPGWREAWWSEASAKVLTSWLASRVALRQLSSHCWSWSPWPAAIRRLQSETGSPTDQIAPAGARESPRSNAIRSSSPELRRRGCALKTPRVLPSYEELMPIDAEPSLKGRVYILRRGAKGSPFSRKVRRPQALKRFLAWNPCL